MDQCIYFFLCHSYSFCSFEILFIYSFNNYSDCHFCHDIWLFCRYLWPFFMLLTIKSFPNQYMLAHLSLINMENSHILKSVDIQTPIKWGIVSWATTVRKKPIIEQWEGIQSKCEYSDKIRQHHVFMRKKEEYRIQIISFSEVIPNWTITMLKLAVHARR